MIPHGSESADADRPTAIVFEKRPRWVPELERQCLAEGARIMGCRSFGDVEERAAGTSRGVMILDLSAQTVDCLRFLAQRLAKPGVPVIAVGFPQIEPWEWLIRDLGVIAFVKKNISGHEMAALCRRQWSLIA